MKRRRRPSARRRSLQNWIENRVGQKAGEDKFLNWSDQAVIQQGETISKNHVIFVNDRYQEKLNACNRNLTGKRLTFAC